jgi:histone-lysine N-methyltransferase SETMAR
MIIAKISELGMTQMPHPPYSPDIVSSEFSLFGHLKHKVEGCSSDRAYELFSALRDLRRNLEKLLLHRVFDELISRFHHVMDSDGEYIQT